MSRSKPAPRNSARRPCYPRVVGLAASVAALVGCGSPPAHSGGVVLVPYSPAASQSGVVTTQPRPAAAVPAPSSSGAHPEAMPDGDMPSPYSRGH